VTAALNSLARKLPALVSGAVTPSTILMRAWLYAACSDPGFKRKIIAIDQTGTDFYNCFKTFAGAG